MARKQVSALAALFSAIAFVAFALLNATADAQAAPKGFSFDGGTAGQQATVREALAASSFDWGLVPGHVTIHIVRGGGDSYATKGEIWLDPNLLSQGRASWGVVQHEYAHQVDFFLFNATMRAQLAKRLDAKVWWGGRPGLNHSELGCERFASTLAWAYWPSRQNSLIRLAHTEATAMAPAQFRHLMDELLASER